MRRHFVCARFVTRWTPPAMTSTLSILHALLDLSSNPNKGRPLAPGARDSPAEYNIQDPTPASRNRPGALHGDRVRLSSRGRGRRSPGYATDRNKIQGGEFNIQDPTATSMGRPRPDGDRDHRRPGPLHGDRVRLSGCGGRRLPLGPSYGAPRHIRAGVHSAHNW